MSRMTLIGLSFLALVGCERSSPKVSLAFSSYESTPVVVTGFALNGSDFGMLPMVVDGRADTARPNEGASRMDMQAGAGSGSSIAVTAEWTELTTGRTWQGALSVPVQQLETVEPERVEMMPVFGPDGLLIVTSDRAADGNQEGRAVDVGQVCGSPVAGSVDYRRDPGALPQLRETLQAPRPPAAATTCSNG